MGASFTDNSTEGTNDNAMIVLVLIVPCQQPPVHMIIEYRIICKYEVDLFDRKTARACAPRWIFVLVLSAINHIKKVMQCV